MKTGNLDGLINDLYQVEYDSGELAAAVASVSITGLTGDTAKEYKLIARIINDDGTNAGYTCRLNNDSGANYGLQTMVGLDSAASAGRDTAGTTLTTAYNSCATDDINFFQMDLYAVTGNERTAITNLAGKISGTTVDTVTLYGQSWSNTEDELTSIVYGSNQSDGIGIGSRIILLKKVDATSGMQTGALDIEGSVTGAWEKIYENDFAATATTLTISSLEGNTDTIYRLISKCVMGSNSDIALRINADDGANYGRQLLYAIDSAVAAARLTNRTNVYLGGYTAGNSSMSELIIYAKSGYERTIIKKMIYQVTGTTVSELYLSGHSWSNTADEITSLVIYGSADGIGIGSHIELWRLNL